MPSVTLPFDPTGTNPANRIVGEQQIITAVNGRDYHYFIPTMAPFFTESFQMTFRNPDGSVRPMVEGVDFYFTHHFISASRACAKPVYGSITFLHNELAGVAQINYQSVGGIWTLDEAEIAEILATNLYNPRTTAWEQITDMPVMFPVVDHEWNLVDMVGMSEVVEAINGVTDAVTLAGQARQTTWSLPRKPALQGNPTNTWCKLGVVAPVPPDLVMNDLYWQIAGGDHPTAQNGALLQVQASIRGANPVVLVKSVMPGIVPNVTVGYTYDTVGQVLTLYLRMGNGNNPMTVTNLQHTGSSVVLDYLGAVEPANITYVTPLP